MPGLKSAWRTGCNPGPERRFRDRARRSTQMPALEELDRVENPAFVPRFKKTQIGYRFELVKKFLEPHIGHEWYLKGMGKEQLEKMKKFYEERYGGTCAK